MQVEEIQAEIEQLSQDKFIQLRRWFAEKDWERWDEQLEQDITTDRTDFCGHAVNHQQTTVRAHRVRHVALFILTWTVSHRAFHAFRPR